MEFEFVFKFSKSVQSFKPQYLSTFSEDKIFALTCFSSLIWKSNEVKDKLVFKASKFSLNIRYEDFISPDYLRYIQYNISYFC